MALSRPVPPNVTVQRVTLDAVGMDQGWGNTGADGSDAKVLEGKGWRFCVFLFGIHFGARIPLFVGLFENRWSSKKIRLLAGSLQ